MKKKKRTKKCDSRREEKLKVAKTKCRKSRENSFAMCSQHFLHLSYIGKFSELVKRICVKHVDMNYSIRPCLNQEAHQQDKQYIKDISGRTKKEMCTKF